MRIALVIERFEPGVGGVEGVAWTLAHGLAQAGDAVEVIARRASPATPLPVRRVRAPAAWQPLRVLAFSHAAARSAAQGRYDVVYSLARTRHQDVYRAGAGCHADYLERRFPGVSGRLRRLSPRHALLLETERRVFADARQRIQCSSELVRGAIARRYGVAQERLVLLRNGVNLQRFRPGLPEAPALRRAWAPGRGPVWLFVGRGFARKGLDTALAAFARGRARNTTLWVAGPDPKARWQRRAARLGVAQRVRFVGLRHDLPTLYAAADALLLPTRYDAFANVCLEAAASGLAVVTSAANGAAELLGEGGIVVEGPEDVDGFARALEALAEPAERARRGGEARGMAEKHGWDAHLAALRQLFARVAV